MEEWRIEDAVGGGFDWIWALWRRVEVGEREGLESDVGLVVDRVRRHGFEKAVF